MGCLFCCLFYSAVICLDCSSGCGEESARFTRLPRRPGMGSVPNSPAHSLCSGSSSAQQVFRASGRCRKIQPADECGPIPRRSPRTKNRSHPGPVQDGVAEPVLSLLGVRIIPVPPSNQSQYLRQSRRAHRLRRSCVYGFSSERIGAPGSRQIVFAPALAKGIFSLPRNMLDTPDSRL